MTHHLSKNGCADSCPAAGVPPEPGPGTMPMDRKVRELIAKSLVVELGKEPDLASLQEAFQLLIEDRPASVAEEGLVKDTISADVLVLCAETALSFNEGTIAADCLSTFFNGSPRRNQFLTRAYYANALLEERRIDLKTLQGADLVDSVLRCVYNVVQGLEIAKSESKYDFLVYNGMLHYWRITRSECFAQTWRLANVFVCAGLVVGGSICWGFGSTWCRR
jgi:hypothetical protein